MTTVYLVRHGETEWNDARRAQGQADIPLNERGRAQAADAGASLASVALTAVYASDLERAAHTAHAIAEQHGLEVTTDPAFREIDQGEWEGLHVDHIEERWPHLWGPNRHFSARPGGESPAELRVRAVEGLRRVVAAHPDGTVAIVSHGGTIRAICAEVLGLDDVGSASLRGVSTGGIVRFEARPAGDALRFSDLVRLDGRSPLMPPAHG